jgi:hypothetical protein
MKDERGTREAARRIYAALGVTRFPASTVALGKSFWRPVRTLR